MTSLFQRLLLAFCCFFILQLGSHFAHATGAASTYFNIYVPPNNDAVRRNVALIVTALYDSTSISIIDDDADGDDDDSYTGYLNAGQSYVLYIKDNGINDDARYASGGELKRDGDYFFINSDKLVFASISTDSDWQHDFAPSVNQKSVGEKYIIYAPKITNSNRDLNVFAYEDETSITISKISQSGTTQTGLTDVDITEKTIVAQRTIDVGQDIIHYFPDGRNIMNSGETYMIETNKPVSVQYGALFGNARDGGGQVPASNGSASGELFYFAVPYQASGEQEIRIVSWDDGNNVNLERYSNGNWTAMQGWNLDRLDPAEWVGRNNGNATYPTVFRVTCSAGKRVSVFEANWLETGSPGTSDVATMLSADNGSTAGKEFLAYVPPPGKEENVVNPATGELFGGKFSHLYLYAYRDAAVVTVKDAKTNGGVINKTFTIEPNRYADCYLSLNEWKSIYNGTGNPNDGDERPYLVIESDENISVMNTNFNDNWMMYFGSSQQPLIQQNSSSSTTTAIPGDTLVVTTQIEIDGDNPLNNASVQQVVASGLIPISCKLINNDDQTEILGVHTLGENSTIIDYNGIGQISPSDNYETVLQLQVATSENNGDLIDNNTVLSVENVVTGYIEGELQQNVMSVGIQNQASNLDNLIFQPCLSSTLGTDLTDSWNAAWIDYNNDGWEDLYITDKDDQSKNLLYLNNNGTSFTKKNVGPIVDRKSNTTSSAWADVNNDGNIDAFIINATQDPSSLFLGNGNGSFNEQKSSGISYEPQYFHGAAWLDYDNDGFVDLLTTNFFETRFHHLYQNNGDNTFTRVFESPLVQESHRSMAPICADYDNDGLIDVFIPNGSNEANNLFRNLGNGRFEKILTGPIVTDLDNSVGAAWGDYDNDGDLDLYVANASGQVNRLYRNDGDGSFSSITNSTTTQTRDSHGVSWVDIDNDADLDLLVTNDIGANSLFINDSEGNFTPKLDEYLSANTGLSFGHSWADYDKDGDMDLILMNHGEQANVFLCNQTNGGSWISIRLEGTNSNFSAIGAKVRVKANDLWQMRQVTTVSGFGSQHSLRQHFGLGTSSSIDSIEINWPSGYTHYLTNVNVDQCITIVEDEASLVTGIAFHDENSNCIKDENEALIPNTRLLIQPGNIIATTNAEGEYSIRLDQGDYSLDFPSDIDYWDRSCSADVNVGNDPNQSFTQNLGANAVVNGYDLSVSFGVTAWRRGFSNQSVILVENKGTTAAFDVDVVLNYPSEVDVKRSSPDLYASDGDEYTWKIDTLNPGGISYIELVDSVTLAATVGQNLLVSLQANSSTGTDLNPTDNSFEETQEIVGAIDPNDILVSPLGDGEEGFIPIEQTITYTIRFQNVGTYLASRVIIENQIPSNLDLRTFELESTSHASEFTISEDGLMRIVYNNIELPDSTSDEPGSHGFFIYNINPKKTLSGGDVIINQAEIVFDYEDPMVTNTVTNTIKYDLSFSKDGIHIYPNPANEEVSIDVLEDYFSFENAPYLECVELYDVKGIRVQVMEIDDAHTAKLKVDEMEPGVYILKVINSAGRINAARLLIR